MLEDHWPPAMGSVGFHWGICDEGGWSVSLQRLGHLHCQHCASSGGAVSPPCLLFWPPLIASRPIYAAADYFILGRTLYYIPYLSPIHPGRVVSTFIGVDVIIEILTGNGAAKLANSSLSPTQIKIGRDMIRASLVLQVILFLCFVALAAWFHRQCHRAGVVTRKLRTIMIALYVSSALILTRSIYRTVEFFEGYTGYLY